MKEISIKNQYISFKEEIKNGYIPEEIDAGFFESIYKAWIFDCI
jgi:hypothetical protein